MMEEMQPEELIYDPNNPRKHSQEQIDVIKHSLEVHGGGRSILIDERGQIISGNATTQAAIASGAIKRIVKVQGAPDTLIAVVRDDLTPDQKQSLSVMDNRATDLSSWDDDVLAGILEEASSVGVLDDTGFKEFELNQLLDDIKEDSWEDHYKGMPEFEQDDLSHEYSVQVNFDTLKDLQDFGTLMGQTVTEKTKSIHFPKRERENLKDQVWVDES